MDNELLNEEVQESFKLLIHLGLLSLGVAVGLYNVGAFLVRPKRQLAANALGYTALVGWEMIQINKHWRAI